MNNLYLRFLQISRALSLQKSAANNIDPTATLLLNEVALRDIDGKTMTVTEAMSLAYIASPATIHRKLDELIEAGLIDQVFEGKNRRTKFLIPTKTANAYFDMLS
jgi:DNA-binding MarR family transcriptional regulator